MIKMISFNNFDIFEAKNNNSDGGGLENAAQDFTAILNGFSLIHPANGKVSTTIQINESSGESKESSNENEPKANNENILPFQNPDTSFVNKPEFANQINNIKQTNVENHFKEIPTKSDLPIDINPNLPEKNKAEVNKLFQEQTPYNSPYEIAKPELTKSKIPLNFASELNKSKEIFGQKAETFLSAKSVLEENLSPLNHEKQVDFQPEREIPTKVYGKTFQENVVFTENQMLVPELENLPLSNSSLDDNQPQNLQFLVDEELMLDLPENSYPKINLGIEEKLSILNTKNLQNEIVEILSIEQSPVEKVKNNFPIVNEANSSGNLSRNENQKLPLLNIDSPVFEQKNDWIIENADAFEVQKFSDIEISETEIKTEIQNTSDFSNDRESFSLNEIVEIKTDNFQTHDLTQLETSQINDSEVKQNDVETEQIVVKPEEVYLTENEVSVSETLEFNKSQPEIKVEIKSSPKSETSNQQVSEFNVSQENSKSAQLKDLKYFFNSETNRVEEVKKSDLRENTQDISKFEKIKSPNSQETLFNETQTPNNLGKLYNNINDIVREDGVKVIDKVQPDILISEENIENPVNDQVQKLVSGSSSETQLQITNSMREINPRGVFKKEKFDQTSFPSDIENNNPQNFAKGEIVNYSVNPHKENAEPNNQISPQNRQIADQINLSLSERSIPKPEKTLNSSREFEGLNFEKFLRSVSNEQEIFQVSSNSNNIESSVFEQIEPKIIELATFVEKSEEKQLLKMRLNPAELGEIEIKLERDASGKIHAQIQTENESARHILAESLGQLRDSLQNSGWQVERLEVHCNPNQSSGNEQRENHSRENETAHNNAFGFDGNVENEGETQENPADRLVNLRA